jgi:hypothetical protein
MRDALVLLVFILCVLITNLDGRPGQDIHIRNPNRVYGWPFDAVQRTCLSGLPDRWPWPFDGYDALDFPAALMDDDVNVVWSSAIFDITLSLCSVIGNYLLYIKIRARFIDHMNYSLRSLFALITVWALLISINGADIGTWLDFFANFAFVVSWLGIASFFWMLMGAVKVDKATVVL